MNEFSDAEQIILSGIAIALAIAIGLLTGIKRGWKFLEEKEDEWITGLRTHGLIGLPGC